MNRKQCTMPFAWLVRVGLVMAVILCTLVPAHAQVSFYTITLTNLTNSAPNSGQPFSPAVFYTHDGSLPLWMAGEAASNPLREIAEEGNNTSLLTDLSLAGNAVGTTVVLPAVLLPGESRMFTLSTDLSTHRFLTNVWMLGRTNDGFAGQASLDLANIQSDTVFDLIGLDAGTEVNNELAAFLPALGGVFNDPENGVVGVHPGILGIGDAPLSWNWNNPVARLSISAPSVAPEAGTAWLCVAALPIGVALLWQRRH